MKARKFVKGLKGSRKRARMVSEKKLPRRLRQSGIGCDCKGCDKD